MREYRLIVIALFVLAVSVTALETVSTASRRISPLDQTLNFIFSPFQRAIHGIDSFSGKVLSLGSLERKQEELQDENAFLKMEVARLQASRIENENLKSLLKMKTSDKPDSSGVSGQVVERDPSQWFDSLTLDVGLDNGVRPGQGVVGNGYVVGKISEVSADSSRVVLLTQERVAIPVEILPGGGQGIAYGSGESGCVVKYIPLQSSVKPGDQVVTSGLGHVFTQKGIPLGVVLDVKPDPESAFFKMAEMKPFLDASSLDQVLVTGP